MTDHLDPDIFDSLFHASAFSAFVEIATASGFPPDAEATKRLAYRYYEEALADKNATPKSLALPCVAVAD